MATQFKVQGELSLNSSGFKAGADDATQAQQRLVQSTNQVKQAAAEATTATTGLADATDRAAATTARQVQTQTTAATSAASHAASLTNAAKAATVSQQSADKLKQANDNLSDSTKKASTELTAYQKQQLGFQFNDVFTQLASGQGVIRTAVQQGPQITQVFGSISATLAAIPLGATAAVAGIAAVGATIIALISHNNDLQAMSRQAELSLQATGRAAGITAAQLQHVVIAESARAGAGRTDTNQAALQLLSNNAISGAQIQQTLALARDLARITGQDLPTAAAALSSGLDGTVEGAKKLDAAFNALTPAELDQIQKFQALGDKTSAIQVVLDALQRNLGNANERGITPFKQAINDLGTAFDRLEDRLSKGKVAELFNKYFIQGSARTINILLNGTPDAVPSAAPAAEGPTPSELATLRQQLQAEKDQLAALRNQKASASPFKAIEYDNSIAAAEMRVRDLTSNLAYLEGRAGQISAKAQADASTTSATRANNDVKDALALVDKLNTVSAQRQSIEGQMAQMRSALNSGTLTPDQVVRTQQAYDQLKGTLETLRTPAEEINKTLGRDSVLAQLPANQQSQLRAWYQAYDQVLKVTGDVDKATKAADEARGNVVAGQVTATNLQIQNLSNEARASLAVADAYGKSRAAAIQLNEQLKAQAAEQQGTIAGGTAGAVAQETLEQGGSAAVAAAAEKNASYALQVKQLQILADAEGKGAAATREATRQNQVAAFAEELRAQAAASGSQVIVAAAERQIAAYDALSKKELATNVQRDAQALNRQYDPQAAYAYDSSRLKELESSHLLTAKTIQEAWKETENKRLAASRDATDGILYGLRQYADEATNAGKAASDGVNSAMKSIEDVGVAVATNTGISFSNMANSIIADLARIAIRQSITGPLAQGISSALPNFFSWIGIGGNPTAGTGPGTGYTYHTGGMVSSGQGARTIDPMVFANAPRYHTGGLTGLAPNERAIVATDDEEILTSSDPRHRWNLSRQAGGSAPAAPVQIVVSNPVAGTKASAKSSPTSGGGTRIDIFFEQVEANLADRMARGTGKMFQATQNVFGLQQAGRR